MGRRVLNRKEMRNDFDAAERRTKTEDEVDEEEDEEEDDDDDEEGDDAAEADGDAPSDDDDDDDDESGDDDDEDGPKKKKKKKAKAKPAPKVVKPKRTRVAKVVRMRVVWGVFNNSNQKVAEYDYPKRDEAVAHAERLMAEKRSTHFVQPVKEAIEEKKEK